MADLNRPILKLNAEGGVTEPLPRERQSVFGELYDWGRYESWTGALIDNNNQPFRRVEPGFNPIDAVRDTPYAPYADSFLDARNPEAVEHIKGQIDRRLAARERIDYADRTILWGTINWPGLVMGALDPFNAIPMPGLAGLTIGKAIFRTGASVAAITLAQESLRSALDPTVPDYEPLMGAAGGAVLGGFFGAVIPRTAPAEWNMQGIRARFDLQSMWTGMQKGFDSWEGAIPPDLLRFRGEGVEVVYGPSGGRGATRLQPAVKAADTAGLEAKGSDGVTYTWTGEKWLEKLEPLPAQRGTADIDARLAEIDEQISRGIRSAGDDAAFDALVAERDRLRNERAGITENVSRETPEIVPPREPSPEVLKSLPPVEKPKRLFIDDGALRKEWADGTWRRDGLPDDAFRSAGEYVWFRGMRQLWAEIDPIRPGEDAAAFASRISREAYGELAAMRNSDAYKKTFGIESWNKLNPLGSAVLAFANDVLIPRLAFMMGGDQGSATRGAVRGRAIPQSVALAAEKWNREIFEIVKVIDGAHQKYLNDAPLDGDPLRPKGAELTDINAGYIGDRMRSMRSGKMSRAEFSEAIGRAITELSYIERFTPGQKPMADPYVIEAANQIGKVYERIEAAARAVNLFEDANSLNLSVQRTERRMEQLRERIASDMAKLEQLTRRQGAPAARPEAQPEPRTEAPPPIGAAGPPPKPIEVLYHGSFLEDGKTLGDYVDADGNLILIPSPNFEGRTLSVSLTRSRDIASKYATKIKGQRGGGRNSNAVVFEIDRSALPKLRDEGSEHELSSDTEIVIPRGKWRVRRAADEVKDEYDRFIKEEYDELAQLSDEALAEVVIEERWAGELDEHNHEAEDLYARWEDNPINHAIIQGGGYDIKYDLAIRLLKERNLSPERLKQIENSLAEKDRFPDTDVTYDLEALNNRGSNLPPLEEIQARYQPIDLPETNIEGALPDDANIVDINKRRDAFLGAETKKEARKLIRNLSQEDYDALLVEIAQQDWGKKVQLPAYLKSEFDWYMRDFDPQQTAEMMSYENKRETISSFIQQWMERAAPETFPEKTTDAWVKLGEEPKAAADAAPEPRTADARPEPPPPDEAFGGPVETPEAAALQEAIGKLRRNYDRLRERHTTEKMRLEELRRNANMPVNEARYMWRVFKYDRIRARREEFKEALVNWFMRPEGGGNIFERASIEADKWIDNALKVGVDADQLFGRSTSGGTSMLLARTLDIPNHLIADFIETDIDQLSRVYFRRMGAAVEMTRTFGDRFAQDALDSAEEHLISTYLATGKTTQAKIDKWRQDMEVVRDTVLGAFGPADPSRWDWRMVRAAKNATSMSTMGGAMLTSLIDPARIIMGNGLRLALPTAFEILGKSTEFTGRMTEQVRRLSGEGFEVVLAIQGNRMVHDGDMPIVGRRSSKVEDFLSENQGRFHTATGLLPFTQLMKTWVGVMQHHAIWEDVNNVKAAHLAGKPQDPKLIERLANSGINKRMALKIADEIFDKNPDGNLRLARIDEWQDETAEAFGQAVAGAMRRFVVTPGIGDKPTWMSGMVLSRKGYSAARAVWKQADKAIDDWFEEARNQLGNFDWRGYRQAREKLEKRASIVQRIKEDIQFLEARQPGSNDLPPDPIKLNALREDLVRAEAAHARQAVKTGDLLKSSKWNEIEKKYEDLIIPKELAEGGLAKLDELYKAREDARLAINPASRKEAAPLSLPFQFMAFGMAAVNKIMLSALNGRERSLVTGAAAMLGMGYMIAWLKTPQSAWERTEEPDRMYRAFEMSGLMGVFTDVGNILENTTGVGPRAALGLEPFMGGPKDEVDRVTTMGGAAISLYSDLGRVFWDTDMTTWQQASAVRRAIIFNNMIWWSWLVRDLQSDVVKAIEQ